MTPPAGSGEADRERERVTPGVDVVWIVESGRSGAKHQARVVSEHLDVELIRSTPIGVPNDVSFSRPAIPGDEGVTYPIDSLVDAVRERDPDLTMFHIFDTDTFRAAPEITSFSTTVLRVGPNPIELAILLSPSATTMVKYLSSFDHIVCASQAAARKIRCLGVSPERTTVIPTSLDFSDDRVRAPRHDAPHTMGFLGRLAPAKNPQLPVHILAAVRELEPTLPTRLIYAGAVDESVLEPLTGVASEARIGTLVQVEGYIEDVHSWFENIGVNLHPSFTENYPQSVLEAARAGVPTVASAAAWTQEWESLVTVPADAPWQWAETITDLLTNEAKRREIALAQQAEARERCNAQDVAREYAALFEDLVDTMGAYKIPSEVKA